MNTRSSPSGRRLVRFLPAAFVAVAAATAVGAVTGSDPSAERWWEREARFSALAAKTILTQAIPAQNPQPPGVNRQARPEAINLSNSQVRASLWGPPGRITVSLGKTDVYDRRMKFPPVLTIDEIRAGCFDPANAVLAATPKLRGQHSGSHMKAGGGWEFRYGAWQAYEFPCQKPVGQIIVLAPDLDSAPAPIASVRCADGTVRFEVKGTSAEGTFVYLPLKTRNVIVVRADFRGLKAPVAVRLFRHQDTNFPGGALNKGMIDDYDYSQDSAWNGPMDPPQCGQDGEFFWIRQDFPAEKTFPKGFHYYLVGRVDGPVERFEERRNENGLGTLPALTHKPDRPNIAPQYDRIRKAPGWAATAVLPVRERVALTAYLTVVTVNDATDPLAAAKQNLREAAATGFDGLVDENRRWYQTLYDTREHGRIFGGETPATVGQIKEVFGSWMDEQVGMTKPDLAKHEMDETNNYFETDQQPWHGLPCFNEIYLTQVMVRNRPDQLRMWSQYAQYWLAAARRNAKEMWGIPGMYFSHGYFPPITPDAIPHTIDTWEFGTESPAQILKVAWDVWDYGGDVEFLKAQVYDPLRELAVFYCAYVMKGADGFYHAIPSMAVEHWGLTYQWKFNKDSLIALSAIRWTLRNAIAAAELLGRDRELIGRWREVLAGIAPYPLSAVKAGPVFAEVAGIDMAAVMGHPDIARIPGNRIWTSSAPYVLGDDINLDSPPDQIELQYRTCRNLIGPFMQETHLLGKHPDLRHAQRSGPIPDLVPIADNNELFTLCQRQPERLLNSRSGRIHLFPCVPSFARLAFREMLARGGFEVTAACENGKTTFAEIKARRSTLCRVANPWPDNKLAVTASGRPVACEPDGHRIPGIEFQAVAGETYRLKRATAE